MSPEVPLQQNMFSDQWVDTRTRTQKKQARLQSQPQQSLMFTQPEIAQFGVNPKPTLPLSPNTRLSLIIEDPRTDEEIEAELQREAEKKTVRMFAPVIGVTPQGLRIRLPQVKPKREMKRRLISSLTQVFSIPYCEFTNLPKEPK